ncbi:cytochrome P450 [Flammula alnicola]|nr:cytochrome P450 [Flammula alnicola]
MNVLVSLAIVFLIATILNKLVKYLTTGGRRAPYPPGPKPRFLVGNAFDLPSRYSPQVYMEWGKKYNSNILYASAFGNHIVVLNKREDADELFEIRSKMYSDRPVIPMVKMMGWERNIALIPYGDDWRIHRKICQQNFRQEAAPKYHPIQLDKVKQFLRGLLESPERFEDHSKLFSVSIPMSTMYGYNVESLDDRCIEAADESVVLGTSLILPGASLVNVFPFLRHIPAWFPGATSHKAAAKVKELTEEVVRSPMDILKKRMVNPDGEVPASLVSNFLEKKATFGASEKEELVISNVAYTVYGAASDTTISATGSFFYAMAIHPEVQRKAQEEIDRIVGFARLPDFRDRPSLPYIEAIYREVLRWRPPVPLAVPHKLTEDDYYKGYFIPKGATVLGNIWAMTHDEDVYPDPYSFKPERFLDATGNLNDDNRILAYGFGRRTCIGKYVASSTMWLLIASSLATFDIRKAKDEFGKEIEIEDDYVDYGIVQHKKHFQCSITPRSQTTGQLVAEGTEI